jgi:hypothetical protein
VVGSNARPVGSSVKFNRLKDAMELPSVRNANRLFERKKGVSSTSESERKRVCDSGI